MKKIFDVLNVVKQKLFVKKDKIHSEKYYRRIDFLNKYFENQKIATVLKHFPGNSNTDPHTGLPEIKISSERLKNELLDQVHNFNDK